ncbi:MULTISPECIES: 23S rRNA pseudouridine(1911/1915/1917) synthase RluD [unclassified Halomonas]|uniref:23S rRNA pseudouridine(1911/1915/1917) synthase RluD n=1 Tax=unclassified Halomonas TaxID=2609666 RepID=UPI0007DA3B43|nr:MULTISPECIES: 23S rRNA pseudouridine(1911/1915/1917) synthase RluD [unclassified Halomonas]MBT2785939.1 23S rRNA pseudouridine(1911/1915/1917) synthase RluD [Halomonas sp. ISL-106]MBT2796961.1 23S rRNA pseudouridine(1911/1915/1917) synthase RluD [Halomonas sp. ISL-104]OAL59018.1 RNA pseudouridine synthase [Halomonas sp. ALS9]
MTRIVEDTQRVPATLAGARLDQAAAELFSDYSRERLKAWINAGELTVDGAQAKPKAKLHGHEVLALQATIEDDTRFEAQDIALDIVYEDETLMVINKAAGMVVHPAAGNPDGTLLNALLHHHPALAEVPRAGIVHRLDKDTTGLMMVAKTLPAQTALVEQLQARSVSRQYDAVVIGKPVSGSTIDAPIGRHSKDRKRQAVTTAGKPAITHFRVVERFRAHTHVRCKLETGRTHQIRVHMAHVRLPLIGDPMYGGRAKLPPGAAEPLKEILREFPRQALHARKLIFKHPVSGETLTFQSDLPDDLLMLLDYLREDNETMR